MKELHDDLREFFDHFRFSYSRTPTHLSRELAEFRRQFLLEEHIEWDQAVKTRDLSGQLDALVDLTYVAVGTLILQGFHHRDWSMAPLHVPIAVEQARFPRALTPEEEELSRSMLEESVVGYFSSALRSDPEAIRLQQESLHEIAFRAAAVAKLQGFPFFKAWDRVHEANLKKRRGPTARSSGYDLIKPEGWLAPDLSDLVI